MLVIFDRLITYEFCNFIYWRLYNIMFSPNDYINNNKMSPQITNRFCFRLTGVLVINWPVKKIYRNGMAKLIIFSGQYYFPNKIISSHTHHFDIILCTYTYVSNIGTMHVLEFVSNPIRLFCYACLQGDVAFWKL